MSLSIREATRAELLRWDALVQQNPDGGQWVHGLAYAKVKSSELLHPRFLVIEGGDTPVYAMALEHRDLAGSTVYFPLGPSVPFDDFGDLAAALRDARALFPRAHTFTVEPFVVDTPERRAALESAGFEASVPIQMNNHTVLVDLRPSVDDIFAGFHKNLRNHIRNAIKHDYRVEKVPHGDDTYRTMYELMGTIAGGKGVDTMRSFDYYRTLWTELSERGQGHFWFGYDGAHEGPQASAFMIGYGPWAIAKDGGSVPDRAIRGGAHLIRWTAMQWFKEQGKTMYDTYVTPPSWRADDESHQMYGPGKFKRLFGPITDHLPSFDLVVAPARHEAFQRVLLPLEWRIRRRPRGIW